MDIEKTKLESEWYVSKRGNYITTKDGYLLTVRDFKQYQASRSDKPPWEVNKKDMEKILNKKLDIQENLNTLMFNREQDFMQTLSHEEEINYLINKL